MRSHRRPSPAARRGFTLVELLVAAALTVVVMAILATAFSAGMSTLSSLKSVVGLSEQLRTVETVMRRDLESQHLEDASGAPVRLSEPRLNGAAWAGGGKKGFLAIGQGSVARQAYNPTPVAPELPFVGSVPPYNTPPNNTQQAWDNYPYLKEGTDPDMPSFRAWDHRIAMTVKATGKSATEGFSAGAPASLSNAAVAAPLSRIDFDPNNAVFVSQWAEVTYFLNPSGSIVTDNADGTLSTLPVFSLHRRQRALSQYPVQIGTTAPGTIQDGNVLRERFTDLSVRTVPLPVFNAGPPPTWLAPAPAVTQVDSFACTPADVTNPLNRMNAFVDWRNYTGGPLVPVFRDLPAGLPEVAPGKPFLPIDRNDERFGSDVVLNNVLSMQVRVMTDASGVQYVDPPYTPAVAPGQTAPATAAFYDTAAALVSGFTNARVKAVQIRIRVYDQKNKQTRQVTIVQDL